LTRRGHGSGKHAIQQAVLLDVHEPGGNRIELCTAGARLVHGIPPGTQ
jgi:catechol 2,3-dioxygenase